MLNTIFFDYLKMNIASLNNMNKERLINFIIKNDIGYVMKTFIV